MAVTTLFVMIGIILIAGALGIVGGFVIDNVTGQVSSIFPKEGEHDRNLAQQSCLKRVCLEIIDLTPGSVVLLVILFFMGVIFFTLAPGEQFTFTEAVYYAMITATTVGYGDISPKSNGGKIFTIFWATLITLVMAQVVGDLLGMYFEARRRAQQNYIMENAFQSEDDFKLFDEDGDGEVNELEFLSKMLVRLKLVPRANVEEIRQRFKSLDLDGGGSVSIEELRKMFKKNESMNEEEKVSFLAVPRRRSSAKIDRIRMPGMMRANRHLADV